MTRLDDANTDGADTADEGSGGEPLPWELPRYRNWLAVAQVNRAVQRALGDAVEPLDIDLARFDMLATILRAPGLTQSELAERLLVGRSNASMLLPELERRRLVRRRPDPDDRRLRRLTLTATGERLARRALARQSALVRHMLGVLDEAECEAMGDMMRRIGHHLDEHPFEADDT